jgi:competence ComEA-like helix-hairpin-helix protein
MSFSVRRSPVLALAPALLVLAYAATAGTTKKPPPVPVNINAANSEQLQTVPGIGPATAEKILQMRKSYGAFKSVDDLLAIRGIGKKRLEKMRKYLTVGHAGSSKPQKQPDSPPADSPKSSDPNRAGRQN